MYPLTCHAGFNAPARAGKFEIVGFTAAIDVIGETAYLSVIDDPAIDPNGKAGFIYDFASDDDATPGATIENKNIIAYEKNFEGDGGPYNATLKWFPAESVKTRYGTSLAFQNIRQGSLCLYVR